MARGHESTPAADADPSPAARTSPAIPEVTRRFADALRDGPVVGGAIGIAVALAGLGSVSALPGAHQLNYLVASSVSWALAGLVAAVIGYVGDSLLVRLVGGRGARRWAGWFPLVAFVVIEVGVVRSGLDHGIELVALACMAVVVCVVLDRAGRRVVLLERAWTWAIAGVGMLVVALWGVASSPPAEHGISGPAVWVAGVVPAAVLLVPLALAARSNGIVALFLIAFCTVFAYTAVTPPGASEGLPYDVRGDVRLRAERPLNVLLVTVDTLRADAVGCYGGDGALTPNIDRLAAGGVLFEQVQSPVPMTYPAHTSLLTGLEPGNHGVVNNMPWPIPVEIDTVPDLLARSMGYSTAAFVSGFTLKRSAARLFQRFELYDDTFSPLRTVPDAWVDSGLVELTRRVAGALGLQLRRLRYGGDRPADRAVDSAVEWLDAGGHQPFFLWVHLFDPHLPYEPPGEVARRHDPDYEGGVDGFWYRVPPDRKRKIVEEHPRDVEHLRALYRAEVTFADEHVGRLLAALEERGLADDTLVVLTSDHGESLGEHEYWFDHSYFLYQTCLAVPLVVRLPAKHRNALPDGTRIDVPVKLIDLAPTLAELCGLGAYWPEGDGTSLAPLFDAGPDALVGTGPAFAVTYDLRVDNKRYLLAVRDGRWKYVRMAARWDDLLLLPETETLYDLTEDPGETRDLAGTRTVELERLRALALEAFDRWAAGDPADAGPVSDADRARLEGIGYF